jgi:hypothetical protein
MLLLWCGFSVFSVRFWSSGSMEPNALVATWSFGLGALAGFIPSLGVVLLYRAKKKKGHLDT